MTAHPIDFNTTRFDDPVKHFVLQALIKHSSRLIIGSEFKKQKSQGLAWLFLKQLTLKPLAQRSK